MEYCEVCGRNQVQDHHIVFRGQAPYMIDIKLNIKKLCIEHHNGNEGPHRNRKIDIKYKYELQTKLFELFDKEYYSEKEIKELLKTTTKVARDITKKLMLYKEGYERIDIISRLMGGRIYAK